MKLSLPLQKTPWYFKIHLQVFHCTSLLNHKCLLWWSGSALSRAGLTFGKQNGGDGDGCVGGKIGLGTPELVGIPIIIRGCSSETALAEFPRFAVTQGPAQNRNLLFHPHFCLGCPNSWGICCLLLERGVCPDLFSSVCVSLVKPPVSVWASQVSPRACSGLLEHQSQPVRVFLQCLVNPNDPQVPGGAVGSGTSDSQLVLPDWTL